MNEFRLEEFTQLEMLYCCLVSFGEDWHYQYFCEKALVEQNTNILVEWGDNQDEVLRAAANLDFEAIEDLQEKLSNLSAEDQFNFITAINALVAIG